jgi:ABC-type bacteriocin/lantibiotic exporter with double-glycine peptidase domain
MPDASELVRKYPSLKNLLLRRGHRRIPIVRQLAATDCGAAALAMVFAFNGKEIPLDDLRSAIGVGRGGITAEALLTTGRAHGFRSRGVQVEIEGLDNLPKGAILYWEFRHFVVFERLHEGSVDIVDPAVGRRSIPMKQFRKAFTGVALLFEPTEGFDPNRIRPKRRAGLFKQVFECKELLARIVSTSVLVQILSAALPLLTGILIDRVVPRKDYSLLLVLAVGFCVFQIFNVVAGFVRNHLFIHLRTQLEARFTLRFLDHLIELPYSYFQQHTSGDLMVRLGSNSSVKEILTSTVLSAFMDGSMASIYLVFLLIASIPLTLLIGLLAGARFALLAWVRWRQKQFLAETLENQSRSSTLQVEMLASMETLKAMGLEHRAAESWSNVFVDGLNIAIKRGKLDATFNVLLSLLGTISSLVLMFYGTYLVLRDTLSLGEMMAFSALAGGFLTPLNNLISSALQLQLLEVYLERLNDVMNTAPEHDQHQTNLAGPLSGALAFEHVSFRYNAQDPLVVEDVSLDVLPGMRIALVGRTGSGKSTMARLMAGLYKPTTGRILFDGKDLNTLNLRSVRAQLGIVTQETQLFGGSIRRNIALSNPEMGFDRVVHAAKRAAIHDDIITMAMGYETMLADRGLSLSGGQRQRLALARALAGNPKMLILDEATSHLDAVTERRVNENLALLKCTRVVIAHRLSTIRDADLILVFDSGRIVERGRHKELMDRAGVYAELVGVQSDFRDEVFEVSGFGRTLGTS